MAAVPSIGRAAGVEAQPAGPGATQELYERYSSQIYGFCVNRLGSRDEAEDATQSTFLNAHRALQRGVTPEAELAWLFKIAHNVCLTRRRSTSRRSRVESPSDLGAVQDILPAPTRESADELIRLTDALSHMPDNQRRAILLREWQGLSYHEIADDLKVSQSAVETLIFRARRALASNLERDPNRPRLLARVRKAFDVGTLLAAAKTLFATSAAVKATAAVVAVSGAAVVATNVPERDPKPAPKADAPAVVAKAPAAPTSAVVAASADPRRVPRVVRRVEPTTKAPPPQSERALPPGQAKKAAAVEKKERPTRSANAQAAVHRSKPAPVQRPVKAKPAKKPRPTKAKAQKPKGPPAAPESNGNGKAGNGNRG
jgi:RNA polymerase sigma factor (sigma-70 family)